MTACRNNRTARTIPSKDDQRKERGHNYKDPYLVQQGRIRTERGAQQGRSYFSVPSHISLTIPVFRAEPFTCSSAGLVGPVLC